MGLLNYYSDRWRILVTKVKYLVYLHAALDNSAKSKEKKYWNVHDSLFVWGRETS